MNSEAFGIVIVEAKSLSLPCIVCNNAYGVVNTAGGLNQGALQYTRKNKQSLYEFLKKLNIEENYYKKLAIYSLNDYKKRFSQEKFFKYLNDYFKTRDRQY